MKFTLFQYNNAMNRLNKTESADFLHCRISLFLKDQFFRLFIIAVFIAALTLVIVLAWLLRRQRHVM